MDYKSLMGYKKTKKNKKQSKPKNIKNIPKK